MSIITLCIKSVYCFPAVYTPVYIMNYSLCLKCAWCKQNFCHDQDLHSPFWAHIEVDSAEDISSVQWELDLCLLLPQVILIISLKKTKNFLRKNTVFTRVIKTFCLKDQEQQGSTKGLARWTNSNCECKNFCGTQRNSWVGRGHNGHRHGGTFLLNCFGTKLIYDFTTTMFSVKFSIVCETLIP